MRPLGSEERAHLLSSFFGLFEDSFRKLLGTLISDVAVQDARSFFCPAKLALDASFDVCWYTLFDLDPGSLIC